MNIELERGAVRDERRASARALLARYPDLPNEQRDDLLRWFRKEASALDVALISMDQELSHQYGLLKREELGPVDKLIGPEAGGGDMYEAEIAC